MNQVGSLVPETLKFARVWSGIKSQTCVSEREECFPVSGRRDWSNWSVLLVFASRYLKFHLFQESGFSQNLVTNPFCEHLSTFQTLHNYTEIVQGLLRPQQCGDEVGNVSTGSVSAVAQRCSTCICRI